jgi:2-oxo-3-hexenedioate decarboxylase
MREKEIARVLFEAEMEGRERKRFTLGDSAFSIERGYRAQQDLLRMHLDSGARLVGRKMGMTSRAKMQQMKIDAPIHGFLTDRMEVADGGVLSLGKRIHPKVEPEIAFLMARELRGAPSPVEALGAVKGVATALEIIDSRYENYDFQLPDVVADNCSSSGFVLGSRLVKPADLPGIANLGIRLELNGRPMQFGSSAAILGNPARSLAELVKLLHAQGESLPAGSVVLAGGATAAIPLQAGDHVRGVFEGLGAVEFRVCR